MNRYILLCTLSAVVEFVVGALAITTAIIINDVFYALLGILYYIDLWVLGGTALWLYKDKCNSFVLIIIVLFLMNIVILGYMFIVCVHGKNDVLALITIIISCIVQIILNITNAITIVSTMIQKKYPYDRLE